MPLTPQQESNLTSAGDCREHWHSEDRILSQDSVIQFQNLTTLKPISDDFAVTERWNGVLVDTTLQNVVVTLPTARHGREFEVVKNAAAHYVSIIPTGVDTILGLAEARIYNYGTALRLKAITGGWVFV